MGRDPRSFRRKRKAIFLVVALLTAAVTVNAFTTDLPLAEQFLAAFFFGGTSIAAFAKWWSLVRPSQTPWLPQHYSGRYRDDSVQGVALPLRVKASNMLAWAAMVLGADLLAMSGYVAITGRGVDGMTVRVIAVILAGFFGLILLLGGLTMNAKLAVADASMVLTPEALYLPRPADAASLRWDDITEFHWTATQPPLPDVSSAPGTSNLRGNEVLDVLGRDGERLARLTIKAMPDPQKLVDALHTALRDASLRAELSAPATVSRLATTYSQHTDTSASNQDW